MPSDRCTSPRGRREVIMEIGGIGENTAILDTAGWTIGAAQIRHRGNGPHPQCSGILGTRKEGNRERERDAKLEATPERCNVDRSECKGNFRATMVSFCANQSRRVSPWVLMRRGFLVWHKSCFDLPGHAVHPGRGSSPPDRLALVLRGGTRENPASPAAVQSRASQCPTLSDELAAYGPSSRDDLEARGEAIAASNALPTALPAAAGGTAADAAVSPDRTVTTDAADVAAFRGAKDVLLDACALPGPGHRRGVGGHRHICRPLRVGRGGLPTLTDTSLSDNLALRSEGGRRR
eukprot:ctg_468.g235